MANGLPALPSDVNVFSDVVLLVADIVSILSSAAPQWGIYLDGEPVVVADNVVAFGFKKGARISKYPQEQGTFASYNKVAIPAEPRLKYSTGGSVADRQAFLDSIDPLVSDTNLYDVVTPEVTYSGYNVINYDYPRTADHAGLITVDAAETNNGLVQPEPYKGPNLGPLQ
jgi:hypothetical protein